MDYVQLQQQHLMPPIGCKIVTNINSAISYLFSTTIEKYFVIVFIDF